MKYVFMNDKTTSIALHAASVDIGGKTIILPAEMIVVNIPDNSVPYIKIWDTCVLLSYTTKDGIENIESILKDE